MNDLSAVELDGLIYVAGTIKRTQKNASNFWCYDPYRNIWTEKAHPNFNKGEIELVKVKEKICIGNTAARLIRYDVARNRWTKVLTRTQSVMTLLTKLYYNLHLIKLF